MISRSSWIDAFDADLCAVPNRAEQQTFGSASC